MGLRCSLRAQTSIVHFLAVKCLGFDLNSLQHSFIHSQNIHCNIKEYITFSEYNPFLVNPAPRPLVLLKVLSSPGKSSTQQLFVSLPTEAGGGGTKHWNYITSFSLMV